MKQFSYKVHHREVLSVSENRIAGQMGGKGVFEFASMSAFKDHMNTNG